MSKKLLSLLLVIAMLMSVVSTGLGAITASAAAVGSGAEQSAYKVFRLNDNNTYVIGTTYSSTIKIRSADANYKIKVNSISAYMPYSTSDTASVSYTPGTICTSSGVDFSVSGSIGASSASPIRYTCNYDLQDANGNTIYRNLTGYGYGYASGKADQNGQQVGYNPGTNADDSFKEYDGDHHITSMETLNTCYVNTFNASRTLSMKTNYTHSSKSTSAPTVTVGSLPPTAQVFGWSWGSSGATKYWTGSSTWWTMSTPPSGFWSFTLHGGNGGDMVSKIYYMTATDKTNALNALNTYLGNSYQKDIYTEGTWNAYLERLDQAAAAGLSVANDTYGYQIGCTYVLSASSNLSTAESALTKDAVTYDVHKDPVVTATATCTTGGATTHYSISGETYDETTPALGHQASGTWVVTQAATCTQTGTRVQYCTRCGEVAISETIPMTSHIAGPWEVVTPATCTTDGLKVQKCIYCGTVVNSQVIPATGHTWGEWMLTTPPSCTEEGVETRTCSVCGATETQTISALGHKWGEWKVTTPATCTTVGKETRICSECNESETRDIPVIAHTWGDWEVTTPATCTTAGVETRTCTVCGATETREIPALGHTAGDWEVVTPATCTTDGLQVKKCTVCGETLETAVIPALGHDYVAVVTPPTCTEQGYTTYTCSRCGDSYVADYTDALGHIWGEWEVTTPATCTAAGVETRTCLVCLETETRSIPVIAHTWGDWEVTTPATCTTAGVETRTCTACGATETREIPALGHTAGDWEVVTAATCTTDGLQVKKCTVCGEVLESAVIPALGHDYVAAVTAPTCTEQGYTTYTCSRCGDSYVADYTDALGHTWGDWEVTTPATCTAEGVETRTCTVCGATETQAIPALGHTAGDWEIATAPTCTTDGLQVKKCTVCGEVLESAVIPALGHDYVAVVTPPLPGVEGYTTYTCSRCGDSYISDIVPALPTDVVASTVIAANDWLVQNGLDVIVNGTYADINSDDLADTVGINVNVDGFWASDSGFQFQLDGLSSKIKTFLQENYADISTIKLDGVEVYKDGRIQSAAIKDVIFNVGGGAFTKLANLGADGVYYQGVISFVENGVERTVDLSITLTGEHLAGVKAMAAKAQDNISVFEEGDATVAEVIAPQMFIDYFADFANQFDLLKDENLEQIFGKFNVKDCMFLLSKMANMDEDGDISGALNTIATVLANNPDIINKIMGRVVSATVEVNGQQIPLFSGNLFVPEGSTYEQVVLKIRDMLSEEFLNVTMSQFKMGDKYGWIEIPVTVVINSGENLVSTNRIEEKVILRANLFDDADCQHQYVNTKIIPATCTEDGLKTVTCAICGDVISETVIPALGHTWGEWEVTTPATCTTAGVETRTCTVCGATETREIPALGHTAGDWEVVTPATCTTDGLQVKKCTVCGEVLESAVIPALGHDYVAVVTAPTCTEQGYTTYTCSRCGDSYVADYTDALGHTWGDWEVTTPATCTATGVETRTCTVCGATETREIPALGHTAGEWEVVTAATCTTDGSQVKKCTVCGEVLETAVIPALGHDYVAVVTAPTCTEQGYTTYTCSRCGDSYVADYTDALGHTWGEWEVTTPATCTTAGVETRTCSVCGATETQAIPALGHTWGDWNVVTPPTDKDKGLKTRTCSVCGEVETVDIDPFYVPDALVVTRGTASMSGTTVTIKSTPNANPNLAFTVKDKTMPIVVPVDGIVTQVSDGRYIFSVINAAKVGDRYQTTMTINGYTYTLVLIYDRIDFSASEVQTLYTATTTPPVIVDNETKTVTVNSKIGGTSVIIYNESVTPGAFKYVIAENEYISKVTTFRYQVTKPELTDQVTSTFTVQCAGKADEVYTLIVNFIPAPFNPSAYIAPVSGGIELKTINGVESIMISKDPTKKYVGIKTKGLKGSTLAITEVSGMQLVTSSSGYTYYKLSTPADEADVASSITITMANGKEVTYPLIFRFKAAEFTPSVLNAVNLDITKSTYNNIENTMSLISDSSNYVRIYKTTISGLALSINVADYPFITETTYFYQIDKSKLSFADKGIANFNIYIADENRTIATSVAFVGSGTLQTDLLSCSNATFTAEGNVITVKIGAEKSNGLLKRNLTNGTERITLTYATPTSVIKDLTATNDAYQIFKSAAGMDITMTISGVTYTLVVTS